MRDDQSQTYAVDRILIGDVMLNYAAGVDERNRQRYTDCFAPDVEIVGFGEQTFHSRDTWVDYVWDALEKYTATQHMLGPVFATLSSAGDTATARTDVQALHRLAQDNSRFTLWATYLTNLRKRDGHWRIVRHELVVRDSHSD